MTSSLRTSNAAVEGKISSEAPLMTPNTRRKLHQLAEQLNVQVEEIEKPPFEINDNTDDILEPRPAAIVMPPL